MFANIAASEAEHTEAVRTLLARRGLPDPASGAPAGLFENQDLQALYDSLVARGSLNAVEALKVGAFIEEKDVVDIREKMAATDERDALKVYQNLLCGSYSHPNKRKRGPVLQGGE